MKTIRMICIALLTVLTLSAVSCNSQSNGGVFVPEEGADLAFGHPLTLKAFSAESPEGEWLQGCSSPDRDDFFDAYVLRSESSEGENTTFTYLIYYPCKESDVTITVTEMPTLTCEENEYTISLTYTKGGDSAYALSYLSVTLPTEKAPDLTLIFEGDELGVMSTVTSHPITFPNEQ